MNYIQKTNKKTIKTLTSIILLTAKFETIWKPADSGQTILTHVVMFWHKSNSGHDTPEFPELW